MDSLLLDRGPWDLCVDALGNIALASAPYAVLQDVSCACRLFTGELYYGPPSEGVPYFSEVLDGGVPTALLRAKMITAARSAPGVKDAQVYLTSVDNRNVGGQVQVELDSGTFTVTL